VNRRNILRICFFALAAPGLTGVEFLRRFAMHILPQGFVKIRYYGILASRYKEQVKPLKTKPDIVKLTETRRQRMVRLTGFDPCTAKNMPLFP
jgi:Putative transposase